MNYRRRKRNRLDLALYCIYLKKLKQSQKREVDIFFKNRGEEGAFEILIEKYLTDNDTKFAEYFRLTPAEFEIVYNATLIDLEPRRQNKNPISARQKLCISLR